jgi:hypothetical protein
MFTTCLSIPSNPASEERRLADDRANAGDAVASDATGVVT